MDADASCTNALPPVKQQEVVSHKATKKTWELVMTLYKPIFFYRRPCPNQFSESKKELTTNERNPLFKVVKQVILYKYLSVIHQSHIIHQSIYKTKKISNPFTNQIKAQIICIWTTKLGNFRTKLQNVKISKYLPQPADYLQK